LPVSFHIFSVEVFESEWQQHKRWWVISCNLTVFE